MAIIWIISLLRLNVKSDLLNKNPIPKSSSQGFFTGSLIVPSIRERAFISIKTPLDKTSVRYASIIVVFFSPSSRIFFALIKDLFALTRRFVIRFARSCLRRGNKKKCAKNHLRKRTCSFWGSLRQKKKMRKNVICVNERVAFYRKQIKCKRRWEGKRKC